MDVPGEKVLIRLLDLLETSIGGVLRPRQIRRIEGANADARLRERRLLAQAEVDIADIRAGRKRIDATGELVTLDAPRPLLLAGPKPDDAAASDAEANIVQGFVEAARDTARADNLQRAVNLKRVALIAEEKAEEIDERAGEPSLAGGPPPKVDADWLSKWRTGAQEVSREEMQRLWASLLAGEVAKPGTYSLHTVDFLSRMSKADADLIAGVAPFAISGAVVKLGNDFFANKGVSIQDILDLEEIGIIKGTGPGLPHPVKSSDFYGRTIAQLLCNGTVLRFDMGETAKSPPQLTQEVMTITKIGREILSLASFAADEDYLQAIADMAIKMGAQQVLRGRLHADGRQILDLHPIAIAKADPPE